MIYNPAGRNKKKGLYFWRFIIKSKRIKKNKGIKKK